MSDILDQLILSLASLPGIGPKSAQKIGVHLIGDPKNRIIPLVQRLADAATKLKPCEVCGNLDETSLFPHYCRICLDDNRDGNLICVVESMAGLMAIERAGDYAGLYHVLGGLLSAIQGRGPKELRIAELLARVTEETEVIIALPVTMDGKITGDLIIQKIAEHGAPRRITILQPGIPVGSSIDALDDNTILAVMKARQPA